MSSDPMTLVAISCGFPTKEDMIQHLACVIRGREGLKQTLQELETLAQQQSQTLSFEECYEHLGGDPTFGLGRKITEYKKHFIENGTFNGL